MKTGTFNKRIFSAFLEEREVKNIFSALVTRPISTTA